MPAHGTRDAFRKEPFENPAPAFVLIQEFSGETGYKVFKRDVLHLRVPLSANQK
jgi:hypothetical protein